MKNTDEYIGKAPLYRAVLCLSKRDKVRFHMPGHTGHGKRNGLLAGAPFDLTELEGLDDLHAPRGAIAQAEELLAQACGCRRAYMFTTGSTGCMHAALAFARTRGDILYTGKMHKSFFGGLQLLGLSAEYVPEEQLEERLKRGAGSLFFTSPDYFGNTLGGEEKAALCKKYGVISVADSAHGAHFPFSSLLPRSLTGVADLCFVSMHKTMEVYTGGAVLCANGEAADECAVYRGLVHTTSPSYLVMASMDRARAVWQERGESYYRAINAAVKKLLLPPGCERVPSDDLSRLVIKCPGDAQAALEGLNGQGIYCEAAFEDKLILILTKFNYNRLDYLCAALAQISCPPLKRSEGFCLQRTDVCGKKTAFCRVEECQGRIAGADMGLYPPGVPQIRRGEIIDKKAAKFVAENQARLFGLAYGRVVVLE